VISVVFSEGPLAGELHELEGELTVGRAGCDLTVADHQVSRRHLRLVPAGEGVQVEDLGSANGTFLNGRQIAGPVVAGDGDAIAFGTSELVVRVAAPPGPPDRRPSRAWAAVGVVEAAVIIAALAVLVSYAG
jgi:pSer/pThr/pTyr-binding forkhead associated (FHA) protein